MLPPVQGKSILPFPQKGYWGPSIRCDAAAINKPASRRSDEKDAEAVVKAFARSLEVYEPKGAYTDETTDIPDDPPYFLECDAGRCGGGDFACEFGYEGMLCSECSKGQFLWRSTCSTKCSDLGNTTAATVFGIIAVVLVWIFMNFNKKCAAPRRAAPRCAALRYFASIALRR